jgi:hypothetical protein
MVPSNIRWILDNLSERGKVDVFSDDRGPAVSINKLTGKAGAFYEKIRYLVDYKEEYSIRRSALERILRRVLILEGNTNYGIALLQELVSGGYLANKRVPEGLAEDVHNIVNKYLIFCGGGVKRTVVVGLAATEIERLLFPRHLEELVADAFFTTLSPHIKFAGVISEERFKRQVFAACRIALLEEDHDTLRYTTLLTSLPALATVRDESEARVLTSQVAHLLEEIEAELADPLLWKIVGQLHNHGIYFSVVREIIRKYGAVSEEVFTDPVRLENEIKKFLAEKYVKQFNIARTSGTRAVIYIFLTKTILAFLIELPYERLFLQSVDYFALTVNVVFHPLLLLGMVKSIQRPTAKNTGRIIAGVYAMLLDEKIKTIYIRPSVTNPALLVAFGILYALLFGVSFGILLAVLLLIHFNALSIVLFLFFLTLVSYFGLRIRYNAQKWVVTVEDERALTLLWNFLTLPIVRTGRWLSRTFSSINVFVFTFDFVIETPFKLILGTLDSFVSFLKEKKENPY